MFQQLEQKRIAEKRELQEKEATLAQAWERAWEAKRADEEEWKARHDTNVAFAQTYKKHVVNFAFTVDSYFCIQE